MAQKFVVQPPSPFQVNQVQLGRARKIWKQLFLIYVGVSDYEGATDKKKVSLLLHDIGPMALSYTISPFRRLPPPRRRAQWQLGQHLLMS